MKVVDKLFGNRFCLEILKECEVSDPREQTGRFGNFYCFHRKYKLGDKHSFGNNYLEAANSFGSDGVFLAVYLVNEAPLELSVSVDGNPWASNAVGIIGLSNEEIVSLFGDCSSATKEVVKSSLKNEIKKYNQYLRGDTYGFNLLEKVEGSWVKRDFRGGFLGFDIFKNGMSNYLDDEVLSDIEPDLAA